MSILQRFWEYEFYQNALLAGLPIAAVCGLLSVFLVHKNMAFIGHGISHAAFGGASLALLLQAALPMFDQPWFRDLVILLVCVASALAIGALSRGRRIGEDTVIGIVMLFAMALGVILLGLRSRFTSGYTPDLHNLLFGNVLAVRRFEAAYSAALALLIVILTLLMLKDLIFLTFDEESAQVFGVRTGRVYFQLLALIGVTTAIAMKLLGVILSGALLILPGVTAALWSRRIGRVAGIAVAIALFSVLAGLWLSMLSNLDTGPLITLLLCAMFGLTCMFSPLQKKNR